MKRRLFMDVSIAPTEGSLRKQLGDAMSYYHGIMRESGDYRKLWQYSHSNGWILKVDDTRKAFFYLAPFDEGIEISLTVRDEERADFLENKEFETLHPQFEVATKYPGGYALRFGIESSEECSSVTKFLSKLMKMRAA
jgi:hypothetical protein